MTDAITRLRKLLTESPDHCLIHRNDLTALLDIAEAAEKCQPLTVNILHMAITDADWTLVKGKSGAKPIEKLPAIVAALSRRLCIACQWCGSSITEETAYSIMGSTICRACFDAHRERRRKADDSCVPTAPFEGDGVRVVRSTKGL